MTTELVFDRGTLLWCDPDPSKGRPPPQPEHFAWDERSLRWRAPAWRYREIVSQLSQRLPNWGADRASRYDRPELVLQKAMVPRPHQGEALKAWIDAGGIGTVVLPTGAGKSYLAMMAIAKAKRATLVVVPTLDLMHQWQSLLCETFAIPIGQLGGGERALEVITVATYDSAALMIDHIGDRFGLVVFDEVHHLPAPHYVQIAESAIAPFRLGLTATPDRADGGEEVIYQLVGSKVYEARIGDLVGGVLAPYHVELVEVALTEPERTAYDENRAAYTTFLRKHGIRMQTREGWQEFIRKASFMPGGSDAFKSYREQRRIAQCASGKLTALWQILSRHEGERILIFTDQNDFAYEIGRLLYLAVLTHQTKPAERKQMLKMFREGSLRIIVTSKVLNEGVDVPEASVGIVISGGAQVREHVQRLGRILRHRPGKQATLYEVVAKNTMERFVNQRRREHDAYS